MYCIYEIKNLINNKTYIGQHKTNNLNDDYMGSGLLIKKSIEKYGIKNFKKNILAITETKENINILEKVFIKLYREQGKAEYNIANGGDGGNTYDFLDDERKKEISLKISESNKGHIVSEETKRKLREFNKGKKLSEEHKKKISESNKGHKPSEETRIKIGKSSKGRTHTLSDEAKRKIGETHKGLKHSKETKKRLSDFNKGKHLSNETKNKISKTLKGRHRSEETKKKISESHKNRK